MDADKVFNCTQQHFGPTKTREMRKVFDCHRTTGETTPSVNVKVGATLFFPEKKNVKEDWKLEKLQLLCGEMSFHSSIVGLFQRSWKIEKLRICYSVQNFKIF